MAEMVGQVVVQEAVSGAFSFVFSSREEKVSQKDLMERLEMVHIKLDLALERSRMMPITIRPLFRLKKKLKDVFKECDDLLNKARDLQQVVPSLRRKIMHAVLPSFIVPNQDMLSSSVVASFERFARDADKFVREVGSGCSLSHYRFLNPLIRDLLEGKDLYYYRVQGSRTCRFYIWMAFVEEYGRVAWLSFDIKDSKTPLKTFGLSSVLRLYESTDIVAVIAKCLQSLGPSFKSLAEFGTGELTQLPTQDVVYASISGAMSDTIDKSTTFWSPDPFCCIANGLNKPCSNNIISSELTRRFPQEVVFVIFDCHFLASEYTTQSPTDEARINSIKAWPPLEMRVTFAPHLPRSHNCCRNTRIIHQVDELIQAEAIIQTEAIDYFIRRPEQTEYKMFWGSPHGYACFCVSKPITKTRRVLKRRR